jgi:acetyl esterase/lipase
LIAATNELRYAERSPRNVLDLAVPRSATKPPLVVYIHGGAFRMGDKSDGPGERRVLLDAGFAVASVNYRYSTEAIWPAQLDDLRDAFAFLRSNADEFHFDGGRVASFGPSAGGHLSATCGIAFAASPQTHLTASVVWFPPVDFTAMDSDIDATGVARATTHDVEDGVVLQRIADFLELLEQTLKHPPLDRVRRDEVEDQAVLALAVPANAPHPLLEAVRIPWNVVIEEDVADLKVDAFAGSLRGDQNLDLAFAELLLGVQARAWLVTGARLHSAVDAADTKAPRFQSADKIVQRVFELGEEKQALVRPIEEALLVKKVLQLRQLRLGPRFLDR